MTDRDPTPLTRAELAALQEQFRRRREAMSDQYEAAHWKAVREHADQRIDEARAQVERQFARMREDIEQEMTASVQRAQARAETCWRLVAALSMTVALFLARELALFALGPAIIGGLYWHATGALAAFCLLCTWAAWKQARAADRADPRVLPFMAKYR